MLYLQTPHLPAEVDAEEDIQDEEYDGKAGEPGCEADGHTIVDVLADAIRSGINAKVGAVASVGRGHGDVAGGVAGEHRQGGSQEKELRR